MPFVTEHMKWRKHRNRLSHAISETDPNPQVSSIIQSTRCKSTISSLLLSTFSNNTSNETKHKKKKSNNNNNNNKNSNFSATTLRGLGCKASASKHVSVPAVIRSSADWQEKKKKKSRKKKQRRNSDKNSSNGSSSSSAAATCVDFQDVWCGPGIGFSVDATVASSVDRKTVFSRGNLDVEIITQRERPSFLGRNTVNTESISVLDDYSDIFTPHPDLESFATSRYYRHVPHPSSYGLSEIMILQRRLLMGERYNSLDQFGDWRLDIDNMSYEQLLELGEKIGYVNTGLKEDEMVLNIKRIKLAISNGASKNQIDKKCTICQEEYEGGEELGRLNCEHSYHFQCIKQWLVHKNFCPVCKQEVVVRHMPKS
ncbi:hypothetical protein TanjilG_06103 [Lupinus angustifolius]|uniref:RING-type E3 ubiquitin transferase n=1 Tax=Lupinus angustifolius TaxID=3871 RepID=A0A1J7HAW0_LUPAN|nr:PREDICTED: uncharacterized protein LOC109358673 isoform X1 [Lupinus angustifolius]XP_019458590.1 PREDICTED: uncharacterized protein LOC109358673 isoform X1 [Lupinus angustifolius]OIW03594.1 hypothetical protein TanjilG_06103 [Lupinus angustifolius]